MGLIDRHYENAGAFLLWLIEKCPLHVWNPDTVQEFAARPYAGNYDWGEHHSLNVWDLPEGTWDGVPKLPPNLTRIVRECLAAHEKWEDNFQEYQDVQLFPIGMAVWNNVVPWQNKMTKRQRCFGPERGNDLSWLALDDLGMYHMETGLHSTCTELIHSVQRLTEIMELTAPFIKLYKYLSHATGESLTTVPFEFECKKALLFYRNGKTGQNLAVMFKHKNGRLKNPQPYNGNQIKNLIPDNAVTTDVYLPNTLYYSEDKMVWWVKGGMRYLDIVDKPRNKKYKLPRMVLKVERGRLYVAAFKGEHDKTPSYSLRHSEGLMYMVTPWVLVMSSNQEVNECPTEMSGRMRSLCLSSIRNQSTKKRIST